MPPCPKRGGWRRNRRRRRGREMREKEGEEAGVDERRTSRRARGFLDASRSLLGCLFGCVLEASWGVLGARRLSQGLLGASWMPRGSVLGPLGGLLGASSGPLVSLLGRIGGLLGASWGLLGASWGPSGAKSPHLIKTSNQGGKIPPWSNPPRIGATLAFWSPEGHFRLKTQ